ncbi:VanZ family protein [Clostridium sp. YIM B02515]|uniref:VanZ family protein n=1 Tax=Clostridium rhizosphaerae TaxID=2803861 RepID=A0ABS1TC79_9CLOT|nr:VanZ family protein [Clostridium rhizosphaerae]MBL4936974.1 VanZ family protein [Clostridium rhizosphaerae]
MKNKLKVKGFKIAIWSLFVIYLLVLINVILLKDGIAFTMAQYRHKITITQKLSGINYIPLTTIFPYLEGKPSVNIAIRNLLGNILAFSPFGYMLPLLFKRINKIKSIFFVSFALSLVFEAIQLIFNMGSCDIDDLILNVSGAILGFGVFCLFGRVKNRILGLKEV